MKHIDWMNIFLKGIGIAVDVVFTWILCIGFMNYGICWRTVIGFVILVGIMETGYTFKQVENEKLKKQKKELINQLNAAD